LKKLLILVLAIVLVLSVVTFASAAVTIGGNFRAWWQTQQTSTQYTNEFKFDRVGINVNADNGNGVGFISNIEFRQIRLDKDASTGSTSNGISNGPDIRVDVAQFYKKNLFATGDQLSVGEFDPAPFKNGYSNVMTVGGLGDGLKMGNYFGAAYYYNQPTFAFAFSVMNATGGTATNMNPYATGAVGESAGYNYSLRVDFMPITGLKAGFGYEKVNNESTNPVVIAANENYNTNWIVDASYMNKDVPYSGLIEYASVSPTVSGLSQDTLTGIYVEGGYKIGTMTLIAARGINLTSTTASSARYGNNIMTCLGSTLFASGDGKSGLFTINNNYTVLGLIVPVGNNTFVQGDYVTVDDSNVCPANLKGESAFGVRLRINF